MSTPRPVAPEQDQPAAAFFLGKNIGQTLVTEEAARWLPVGVLVLLCGLTLWRILALNDGHFSYSLDDPYIHLALAENLIHGHYGVNLHEVSAPSSSLLWPFLLAPFTLLPWSAYAPLLLNFFSAAASLLLLHRVLDRSLSTVPPHRRHLFAGIIGVVFLLATNQIGLMFTGMEHALQVTLSLLLVAGLIEERESGSAPWWLAAALMLGPLVRYENLALSGPALLYLGQRGQWRTVLVSGSLLAVSLGAFSAFLHAHDLSLLPNSVLAKSNVAAGGGSAALTQNLLTNLTSNRGFLLSLLLLVFLCAAALMRDARDGALALWMSLGLLGHLAAGRFGWYHRYELYIWAASLLLLLYLARNTIAEALRHQASYKVVGCGVLFLLLACRPYLEPLLSTPVASNNIYEQQYQMHRFVTAYLGAPVAVNDLGWVSFQNDQYVLDLYGLASMEALRQRQERDRQDVAWMDEMARARDVNLAMLYRSWFPMVPKGWVPLGTLYLGRRKITPASDAVMFYAINAAAAEALRPKLEAFSQTLPGKARFTFAE